MLTARSSSPYLTFLSTAFASIKQTHMFIVQMTTFLLTIFLLAVYMYLYIIVHLIVS
jgi:hypothetical protein